MKYSAILLSALAVGAIAAPQRPTIPADASANSQGGNDRVETQVIQPGANAPNNNNNNNNNNNGAAQATISLGDSTTFTSQDADKVSKFSFGGINKIPATDKVTLTYAQGVQAKPRCMAKDKDGNALVVMRGQNKDFTFADGQGWTFIDAKGQPTKVEVTDLACDAEFKKIENQGIVVELGTKVKDPKPLAVQFKDLNGGTEKVDSKTAYRFVTLKLGPEAFLKNKALRCQIKGIPTDNTGKTASKEVILEVNRGDNVDKTTFGDGFKGAWLLSQAATVTQVECSAKLDNQPQGQNGNENTNNDNNMPNNDNVPNTGNGNSNDLPSAQSDLRVQLTTASDSDASGSLNFQSTEKRAVSVGGLGPQFATAQISFADVQGAQTNKATRCQVLGKDNQPLTLTLSTPEEGKPVEFVSNFGGERSWDIVDAKDAAKVECDPKLVKKVVEGPKEYVPSGMRAAGGNNQAANQGTQNGAPKVAVQQN